MKLILILAVYYILVEDRINGSLKTEVLEKVRNSFGVLANKFGLYTNKKQHYVPKNSTEHKIKYWSMEAVSDLVTDDFDVLPPSDTSKNEDYITTNEEDLSLMQQKMNYSPMVAESEPTTDDYDGPPKSRKSVYGAREYKYIFRQKSTFVDKSLMIKDFIYNDADVMLVTCPRRWGKTINLSMLRTFFELNVDEYGKPKKRETTFSYKLFSNGEVDYLSNYKVNLKISECKRVIENYLGKYPVIHVSFLDVKCNTYKRFLKKVKSAISCAFTKHYYLLEVLENRKNSDQIGLEMKKRIQSNLHDFHQLEEHFGENASEELIERSLFFLSKLLHDSYKQKVYIFIDEYDVPIASIIENPVSASDSDKMLALYRSVMLNALKENEFLKKGFVTGVLQISETTMLSSLNNIKEFNYLDNVFGKYYGITKDEMNRLFEEHHIEEELQKACEHWYDGYKIKGETMYNTWSIIQFLATREIISYWAKVSNVEWISPLLNLDIIKHTMIDLLYNRPVQIKLNDLQFTVTDFVILRNLRSNDLNNRNVDDRTKDIFLRFMCANGYLTPTYYWKGMKKSYLSIPNNEIRYEIQELLINYPNEKITFDEKAFNAVVHELTLLLKNSERTGAPYLEYAFQNYVNHLPEFIDMPHDSNKSGIHANEDMIHTFFFSALSRVNLNMQIGSEVPYATLQQDSESEGKKWKTLRPDIIVNIANEITFIEFKFNQTGDKALKSCRERYSNMLHKYENATKIRYIGIGVTFKKQVSISLSNDNRSTIVEKIKENYKNLNKNYRDSQYIISPTVGASNIGSSKRKLELGLRRSTTDRNTVP